MAEEIERNYQADWKAGRLERRKWVVYVDGKLWRSADTQPDARRGAPRGHYACVAGRDDSKITILLSRT